jgi:DNA-binding FadR family transcriptional regulator
VRDAIAAGDPKRAKAAMQEHLRRSQERFSISFRDMSTKDREAAAGHAN